MALGSPMSHGKTVIIGCSVSIAILLILICGIIFCRRKYKGRSIIPTEPNNLENSEADFDNSDDENIHNDIIVPSDADDDEKKSLKQISDGDDIPDNPQP
mmetsp:Transcript_3885/g.4832  ORF Transcript_3885/g.4832 Transcript_3885/m.4832 type:complete len:100 (+) Transcript_3885:84-383(+)